MRRKGSRKWDAGGEQEVSLARGKTDAAPRGGMRRVCGAEMSRNYREGCLNKDSLDVALQFEMEMKRFYRLRNWDTSDLFSSV